MVECQYAIAIKRNWNGKRPQAICGVVFKAAPFVMARYIFAGKTAISSSINPQAATYLVFGKSSIVPNNISKKPDIYTNDSL
tara:strand:+ start:1027 stop:1272 length:246 start_codon:yes stop_codon:yes gene_type:complete